MRATNLRWPASGFLYSHCAVTAVALVVSAADWASLGAQTSESRPFYVPANPNYTLVDSVADSLRFTLTKTLQPDADGHLVPTSGFVNPEGGSDGLA